MRENGSVGWHAALAAILCPIDLSIQVNGSRIKQMELGNTKTHLVIFTRESFSKILDLD